MTEQQLMDMVANKAKSLGGTTEQANQAWEMLVVKAMTESKDIMELMAKKTYKAMQATI